MRLSFVHSLATAVKKVLRAIRKTLATESLILGKKDIQADLKPPNARRSTGGNSGLPEVTYPCRATVPLFVILTTETDAQKKGREDRLKRLGPGTLARIPLQVEKSLRKDFLSEEKGETKFGVNAEFGLGVNGHKS